MQRVLIISTTRRLDPSRQPLDDLTQFTQDALTSAGKDASVTAIFLDQLVHVYDGPNTTIRLATTGEDIAGFDFTWLRGRFVPIMNEIALVAEYLEQKGATYANHSYAHRSAYGKNAQMRLLSSLGLPYPKTVYATGEYAAVAFTAALDFPMIVKNNHGAHGEKNYLVHSTDELSEVLGKHPDTDFVAQEYLPNEADYRILLVGDQQIIIRREGKPGSHLNNTSQGATASLVEAHDFPAEVLQQARQFAAALHYDLSGVDVLFSSANGQHYFLEANSQPQLISGAFIQDKQRLLGEYLAGKLAS